MSAVVAIEFNDSGVILSDGTSIIVNSPGYCIHQAQNTLLGNAAMTKARLLPNDCHSSYWSDLAAAQKDVIDRENINLALLHLREIWSQAPAGVSATILTVPANYSKTGLGILLGICKELSIPVNALVHHAALTPSLENHAGATVHVELQLHHCVISYLEKDNEEFRVIDSELLPEIGLQHIYKNFAQVIGQAFVSATRFDPLHNAENEQQLYNSVANWLHLAKTNEQIVCQLHHHQQVHEIVVEAATLENICRIYVNKILDKVLAKFPQEKLALAVSHKINELLGFSQHASLRGVTTLNLAQGHHANLALQHAEHVLANDEQVYLIKQLPVTTVTQTIDHDNKPQTTVQDQPSHVLFCNHAYRLQDALYLDPQQDAVDGFCLVDEDDRANDSCVAIRNDVSGIWIEPLNSEKVTLNDRVIDSGAYPNVGDYLQVDDCEESLMFIKVHD